MRYFDHDTTASSDDKVCALRLECGGAAVDAYWTILEQMYRDETDLVFAKNRLGFRSLAHRLCTDEETLGRWISTMCEIGLIERREDPETGAEILSSERVRRNVADYEEKRETARQNGRKGGRKPTAKPTGNQAGSTSETEAVPSGKPGAKLRKEKKGIGSYTKNQIPTAGSGAAAAEAAPPPAGTPCCPLCGSEIIPQTVGATIPECPNCGGVKASSIVWRCET